MAVQLLEQDGFGAAHGGAHAGGGQVEGGGDLGVAEAAVPEHERGSRLSAARTALRSSRVTTRSATSGATVGPSSAASSRAVRRRPERSRLRAVWVAATVSQPRASPAGTDERPKERNTSWATATEGVRDPRTRAATDTTRPYSARKTDSRSARTSARMPAPSSVEGRVAPRARGSTAAVTDG